jgi:ABC-type branched-subunit amino acid transport system ATPase component/ABC-type branched-subunit amino acid transport system permease subunit
MPVTLSHITDRLKRLSVLQIALIVLLLLIVLPIVDSNTYHLHILTFVFIYVCLSLGLNLMTGLAGLVDLGYIAFFAVGAYGYALLSRATGLSILPQLPIIAGIAICFGLVLGLPALRVRGDYLAIVTLGFGEIVRLVATNWHSLTNGPLGIRDIPFPTIGVTFTTPTEHYCIALALLGLVFLFTHRLAVSRIGWAWCSLRTDENLAKSLSHNLVALKLFAFCTAAVIAGISGSFFASVQSFVSPESFIFFESIIILSMVILGGGIGGNLAGVVIGAFILSFLPELFRGLSDFRFPIYGIVMAVLVLAREKGIFSKNWLNVNMVKIQPQLFSKAESQLKSEKASVSRDSYLLEAVDLSRNFGGLKAVNGFNFQFLPGQSYGILGQNGAGKTTLINLLSGVLNPSSGMINIAKKNGNMNALHKGLYSKYRHLISRTFQNVLIVPDLNAVQNVYMACRPMSLKNILSELNFIFGFRRFRERQIEDYIKSMEVLKRVGFPLDKMDISGGELPFGLKRKVELARALVRNPAILLLDEPLSGLAEQERAELYHLLIEMKGTGNRTLVFIEHQYPYLKDLCDTILYMESGNIPEDKDDKRVMGDYNHVINHPIVRNSYFGSMEVIEKTQKREAEINKVLEISGLNVDYPLRGRVLYDVNILVNKEDVVLVSGLNGAGKTTILNSIMGIYGVKIVSGKIKHRGDEIKGLPSNRRANRGIVFVPQEKRVFPSLTVQEHLDIVNDGSNQDEKAVDSKMYEYLPALSGKRKSRGRTLSGGQQQMLALAMAFKRAILAKSEQFPILLLDEPTMGLQASLVEETIRLLHTLNSEFGISILVTEQRPEIRKIANNEYVIEAGHIAKSTA